MTKHEVLLDTITKIDTKIAVSCAYSFFISHEHILYTLCDKTQLVKTQFYIHCNWTCNAQIWPKAKV